MTYYSEETLRKYMEPLDFFLFLHEHAQEGVNVMRCCECKHYDIDSEEPRCWHYGRIAKNEVCELRVCEGGEPE